MPLRTQNMEQVKALRGSPSAALGLMLPEPQQNRLHGAAPVLFIVFSNFNGIISFPTVCVLSMTANA